MSIAYTFLMNPRLTALSPKLPSPGWTEKNLKKFRMTIFMAYHLIWADMGKVVLTYESALCHKSVCKQKNYFWSFNWRSSPEAGSCSLEEKAVEVGRVVGEHTLPGGISQKLIFALHFESQTIFWTCCGGKPPAWGKPPGCCWGGYTNPPDWPWPDWCKIQNGRVKGVCEGNSTLKLKGGGRVGGEGITYRIAFVFIRT